MKRTAIIVVAGLLGVVAFLGMWLIGQYNQLVNLDENVSQAQAQVETQLQRRFDLIPNLVNTVEGVMDQEEDIFLAIAEARKGYSGAQSGTPEKLEAAGQVESSLGRLLVIMENYPTLQSNTTALALMDELAGTENRISTERGRYNEQVTAFNKKVRTFPTSVIAGMMNFDKKDLFESAEGAEVAPVVDLTDE